MIVKGEIIEISDNTNGLAAYTVDNSYIKKFWRKEGICVSKYQSVDKAIKWVQGYFKAVDDDLQKDARFFAWEGIPTNYGELYRELDLIEENWGIFANKLTIKLENEIDRKINENGGTRQLMKNLREGKSDIYSVDFLKVVIETFQELNWSSRPAKYINADSRVAPDYFSGFGYFVESFVYDSGKIVELSNVKKIHDIGMPKDPEAKSIAGQRNIMLSQRAF